MIANECIYTYIQNPFLTRFWPKKHSPFILIWNLAAVSGHPASFGLYFKISVHFSAAFSYKISIFSTLSCEYICKIYTYIHK